MKENFCTRDEDFLQAAFRGYDKNKDGKISMEEFKRVMTRRSVLKQRRLFLEEIFSSNMSKGQVENMVKAADLDGNG